MMGGGFRYAVAWLVMHLWSAMEGAARSREEERICLGVTVDRVSLSLDGLDLDRHQPRAYGGGKRDSAQGSCTGRGRAETFGVWGCVGRWERDSMRFKAPQAQRGLEA